MSGSIVNAKNASNNLYQPLEVNANGKLMCSLDDTDVDLNTDQLESLITSGNTTLSSIDNKVILPSALDADRLKTVTTGSVTVSGVSTEAKQDSIISTLGDTNNKIDAMRGSNSITDLATKLNAGLPSALDSDRLKVAVASLPAGTNNIGDVDIASALPSGSNTIGKVNVGTFDNSINVADGGGSLTVDNSVLTSLNSAINSNRVDVNIANGGFSGAVTNSGTFAVQVDGDALTSLQLIDDIVKSEDAAHSGGDKGIQMLSVRKDTATNLAGSDADYQPLITDANGRLHGINKTAKSYGSETSYVSGQSISGSGTFEGSAIALDANTIAIYAEHNFSHTGIKFEILASIDGSNFFSTGIEFNAGGMSPATLTGISTIKGTSGTSEGFPPHIKFKFSNSDSSAQNATLSFVVQSS